jgi:phosphoglycolate phosphatase-like HAD superfamily hydrolase
VKKPPPPPQSSISLPISPRGRLIIIDRDATIISSRQIAYGCYRASFDRVIRKTDPEAGRLSEELFSRAYHPFSRTGVYEVYYPDLDENDRKRIGEVSWEFYLSHCGEPEFNRLIPGMDEFIRALKAAGAVIAVLTASESQGIWLKHYRIPLDGLFSVQRLKKDKIIEGGKPAAVRHILDQYEKSPREAVTIGDNPEDHVEEITSIGSAFGLACPDARRDLEEAVDIYVPRVENLYGIFNLIPTPAPAGAKNRKGRRR